MPQRNTVTNKHTVAIRTTVLYLTVHLSYQLFTGKIKTIDSTHKNNPNLQINPNDTNIYFNFLPLSFVIFKIRLGLKYSCWKLIIIPKSISNTCKYLCV